MVRGVFHFLTRDWQNKIFALGLAVIIFLVVDEKITESKTFEFTIRFGRFDRNARENTIYLTLNPEYTAALLPPPGSKALRTAVKVHFTGPRLVIAEIREPVLGNLGVSRTIQDPNTLEDLWTIVGSQIRFSGVDPAKVQIDIPDLQIQVLRLETRHVEVAADLDWFTAEPGYRKGEPRPARDTVQVTCPKKYSDFDTVRLRPVDESEVASTGKRLLKRTDNKRIFEVVRPPSVPANIAFTTDTTEMEVTIELLPVNEKLEIEVPIVLIVPTDGSLGTELPRTNKIRETFTFIGPASLLKRCKELEGTDQEIQAVIDLTRLGSDRIAELKAEGIRVKPSFFYPLEQARTQISCEQPKDIWVTPPRPKDE